MDSVVVNRGAPPKRWTTPISPDSAPNPGQSTETIISSFPDIPILPLRLFDEEMVGQVERLRRLAGEL